MIDTAPRTDAGLPDFLAARARHSSDERLTADAAGGLIAAVAIASWRGPAWELLFAAALCFLAFGLWGITDRELGERQGAPRGIALPLTLARAVTAVLGFSAAAFLVLALLGRTLGRMIS